MTDTDEIGRILIQIHKPVYGSADPDPYKNRTDPQHWTDLSNSVGSEPGADRLVLHGLSHQGDLVDAERGRLEYSASHLS